MLYRFDVLFNRLDTVQECDLPTGRQAQQKHHNINDA
jgi:hypothetical protein